MTHDAESHLDELTVLRLTDGELSEDRSEAARRHLISCAHCRSGYEALRAESELLRASVTENEEALPEHIRPRQQDVSWLLVAGLALGTLGVSTAWTRYVTPFLDRLRGVGLDGETSSALLQTVMPRSWTDLLLTLVDGLLVLAIVAGGGYVLLRLWRRLRGSPGPLSVLLLAALGPLCAPTDAAAAVFELDAGNYTLAESERIDNDLVVSGANVVIEGTIDGDLIVAAARVEVRGRVEGDVLGVAERIVVTGAIGGNLRALARTIELRGSIARNISAGGGRIELAPGALLGGSFTAAGRDVEVSAAVERDVLVAAGITTIDARIGGGVLGIGDRMRLGADTSVGSRTRFFGGAEPDVHPDAFLDTPLEFEVLEEDEPTSAAGIIIRFFYFWGAAFLFGAVAMLLVPEASEEIIARHVPEVARSILLGALASALGLVFAAFVSLTVVGVPLGLFGFSFLGFGLYVAQAFVGAYIGRELMGTPSTASQAVVRLGLGLLFIHAVKALPYVTSLVTFIIALWGFGALAAWLLDRTRHGEPAAALGEAT